MNSPEFLIKIFEYLNATTDYVVLRNYDKLPYDNSARDIDMIIREQDWKRIRLPLAELIEQCGWQIITYLQSDRLQTYVCGMVTEAGHAELVQLDFFYNTSTFGIELMSADDFLADREFNGFLWHSKIGSQFLDKYLYNRSVGAGYPEKYRATREAAERLPEVERKLQELFGTATVAECDAAGKSTLLKTALKHNFRKYGIKALGNMLRFEYYRLRNYLCSDTGFSIGFTGPDGAGKTTVIEGLIEELGDVFRKAHVYFHFRPMLFGNLGDVAQSAGLKKEVDRNYDQPHRGGKTSKLSSLARLFYYSADYILGYWLRVKTVTRITRLAIFDRYFTDIICDSRRTRIYLNYKFLYHFGRIFIPQLDYNILLTARTETILSRKRELDRAGIEDINAKIDYLAGRPGYYKVLNEGTPQEAIASILRTIFSKQHERAKFSIK